MYTFIIHFSSPICFYIVSYVFAFFFFFFQAEDGIRDVAVTGVQTCALPISRPGRVEARSGARRLRGDRGRRGPAVDRREGPPPGRSEAQRDPADHDRGGVLAAGPRLDALHARRDAGTGLRDARHQVRRAEDRDARGRDLASLPAPLQLSLVLGG